MSDREGNRSMTTHGGASQVERTCRVDIQEVSNPTYRYPSAERTAGATTVPSSSIERSTSACGMAPTDI